VSALIYRAGIASRPSHPPRARHPFVVGCTRVGYTPRLCARARSKADSVVISGTADDGASSLCKGGEGGRWGQNTMQEIDNHRTFNYFLSGAPESSHRLLVKSASFADVIQAGDPLFVARSRRPSRRLDDDEVSRELMKGSSVAVERTEALHPGMQSVMNA